MTYLKELARLFQQSISLALLTTRVPRLKPPFTITASGSLHSTKVSSTMMIRLSLDQNDDDKVTGQKFPQVDSGIVWLRESDQMIRDFEGNTIKGTET